MAEYKFVIPGRLWDLNKIIASSKQHWGKYKYLHDEQVEKIGWAIMQAQIPQIKEKIDLQITWYEKHRRRDKDNISAGGLKLILDALQETDIIKNDGWKEIGDIEYIFKVDKDNPKVEVIIKIKEIKNDK